ncbi:MAG TPA: conjugative transposon protein TraM [Flavisolibacter sp.]|jgi:conjugative transposon TraM protein|nr:conjugative transposon protein TraM [Flavisolibacter sp.]
MRNQPAALVRKRKALLLLPLLVIPFLTIGFWAMGGGKSEREEAALDEAGLNLTLPDAQLADDGEKTKLQFYEAEKRLQKPGADTVLPLPGGSLLDERLDLSFHTGKGDEGGYEGAPFTGEGLDRSEERVYQKIADLNRALAGPGSLPSSAAPQQHAVRSQPSLSTRDVDRLEEMIQSVGSRQAPDPEWDQMHTVMEKILDIQHPERVKERQGETAAVDTPAHYTMMKTASLLTTSCLDTTRLPGVSSDKPAFFSLSVSEKQPLSNAIEASVHRTQTLASGAVVRFRLLADATVGSHPLPKGSLLSGTCQLAGERLQVQFRSVVVNGSLYPVKLNAYDLDGIQGLYVPDAITRDVAKQSVDNSAQMLEISTLDPSLKGRVTTAGVGALKNLLSKKVKQVKVTLKAGYKVWLKEEGM